MLLKMFRRSSPLAVVMNVLRSQSLDFEGPFRTAKGRIVFRIQNQVVLDGELVDLFESRELNPDGIRVLLRKLRAR